MKAHCFDWRLNERWMLRGDNMQGELGFFPTLPHQVLLDIWIKFQIPKCDVPQLSLTAEILYGLCIYVLHCREREREREIGIKRKIKHSNLILFPTTRLISPEMYTKFEGPGYLYEKPRNVWRDIKLEGKKTGWTKGWISRRRLFLCPTIQKIIFNNCMKSRWKRQRPGIDTIQFHIVPKDNKWERNTNTNGGIKLWKPRGHRRTDKEDICW